MKRNGLNCDNITVMGRPRRLDRVLTRSVGAAVPIEDADRMAELCARVGVSQSDVVRAAVYAFMADVGQEEASNPNARSERALTCLRTGLRSCTEEGSSCWC